MRAELRPEHRPDRKYVMSHMIADTEEELHAMADKIGVARRWHQGDHYDITQAKKALAVAAGAVALTKRQLAKMATRRRRGLSKYAAGDRVWLAEFDNGDEVIPRQRATVLFGPENDMWTVEVVPEDDRDDGLRELSTDQIEGPA